MLMLYFSPTVAAEGTCRSGSRGHGNPAGSSNQTHRWLGCREDPLGSHSRRSNGAGSSSFSSFRAAASQGLTTYRTTGKLDSLFLRLLLGQAVSGRLLGFRGLSVVHGSFSFALPGRVVGFVVGGN